MTEPTDRDVHLSALAWLRAYRDQDSRAMSALLPQTEKSMRMFLLFLTGMLNQALGDLAARADVSMEDALDQWQSNAVRQYVEEESP